MFKRVLSVILFVFFSLGLKAFAAESNEAWMGVWGETVNKSSGYLAIQACQNKTDCDLLLKYYDSKSNTGLGCYGQDLSLKRVETTFVGERKDYGGCKFTFELDSEKRVIKGKMVGKGCRSYCTGPSFRERYPFRHKEPNLYYDFSKCEKSSVWNTWCTTQELQKLDKDYESQHDKLGAFKGQNNITEAWAARDKMINVCESAQDVKNCIRSGYVKMTAEIAKALGPAEKEAAIKLKKLVDEASVENRNFKDWEGRWEFSEEAEEPQISYDGSLDIKDCTAVGCEFSEMNGSRVSTCSSDGKFKFSKDGAFIVVRDPLGEGQTGDEFACRISFEKKGNAIRVDSEGNCNPLCGVSGGGPYGTFIKKIASFNCAGKLSATEELICKTPEVADLDLKLANLYSEKKKISTGVILKALTKRQKEWVAERNKGCASVKDKAGCLLRFYQDRIDELAK